MDKPLDFMELSQLLFGQELLVSESVAKLLLSKHELAMKHGNEYVGVVKKGKQSSIDAASVYKKDDGTLIGVIPVKGTLVYEETGWEALCGMTSYEGIKYKVEHMIKDKGVKEILLDINSGGGMAYGCFEIAQYVRDLATDNGVNIKAYVDGVAYSGGYAWLAIADEVVVNPMAGVGSIGVVLPLVNTSERDKKEGIKRVYVTAGKSKVPFDEDGNYTKEALGRIEDDVNDTYKMFVDHVANNRNLDKKAVEETEAKTFRPKEALKLGLIDNIMSKEQFYKHINFNGEPSTMATTENDGTKVQDNGNAVHDKLVADISKLEGEKQAGIDANAKLQVELDAEKEKVKQLTTQLEVAQKEKASAILASRTAKITALVSEDDVADHMEFAADMDGAMFDKYVAKLAKTQEKISQSFVEQGVDEDESGKKVLTADERMAAMIKAKGAK